MASNRELEEDGLGALQRRATARRLRELYRAGVLDAQAYDRALVLAAITPDGGAWRRFIDGMLASLGAAFLLAGMVFFFAFNWAAMHRFVKFAVVEVALLTAVALAARLGVNARGGRAALLTAAVIPGVLLALYGQIYQTGADPYWLFLAWGLLILPWAIIARSSALCLLLLILANLSLMLWWVEVYRPPEWWGFAQEFMPQMELGLAFADGDLALFTVALNSAALALWEVMASRGSWRYERWVPRVIVVMILGALIVPVLRAIVESNSEMSSVRLAPLVWLAVTALGAWVYRRLRRDLFVLAALALEAIAVITTFLAWRIRLHDATDMLLMTLLVMVMFGIAVWWLRQTARGWEQQK